MGHCVPDLGLFLWKRELCKNMVQINFLLGSSETRRIRGDNIFIEPSSVVFIPWEHLR